VGARRLVAAVVLAFLAWWLVAPSMAGAQAVDPIVEDLRNNNVTFQQDALSDDEIDELDSSAAKLQGGDGYFKVVVLKRSLTDFDDASAFADSVRSGLGGRGRVVVYTPSEVAVSSNLDSSDASHKAATDAATAFNEEGSYDDATRAAARSLGFDISKSSGSDSDSSSAGSWLWPLLLIGVPVLGIGWLMWRAARKMREGAAAASAQEIGAAETKVRTAVDQVANGLLELADRVEQPNASPEAKAAFTRGADMFTSTQEMLEGADTRPELEEVYPKVVEAGWNIDVARALLDGQPAPPKPEPEDLFPRVLRPSGPPADLPAAPGSVGPAPAPVPAPAEPHYQQPSMSPWITAAAMAAMTMLSQRGMSVPRTRPSMDDGAFGNWTSSLPPTPAGGRGRGGRGPIVASGRHRGRGVA
jgi:hypothetical protein